MLHASIGKPFYRICYAIVVGFVCALPATHPVRAATNDTESEDATARAYAVDIQKVHPNGAILRVSQVTLAKLHTAIQASVVNGSDTPIALNHWYRTDPTVLLDAQGNAYRLTPPQGDEEIQVPAGHSLEGTFVFLGQIPAASKTLTLVINPAGSATDKDTAFPQFKAELLLTTLSDAADRNDKKKE
jgi:hypothetical protein